MILARLFDRVKEAIFLKMRSRSMQQQINSKVRDLNLWGLKTNERGHIAVDSTDVCDLLSEYGSPLMVVNCRRLKDDSDAILDAMQTAPKGSKVLYSYKTNCIPGILSKLHTFGIGAEVISPYELWLAEKLGVSGDMIVYNGVNKTDESIERAVQMDILSINIDHMEEIERIHEIAHRLSRRVKVGIRLGLIPSSQFGLTLENGEALNACKKIATLSDYLDLRCIHFNVTSNARSAHLHKACAAKAVEFIANVLGSTGQKIEYIDIGGGIGVPTSKNMSPMEYGLYRLMGTLPKPPSPEDFQPINEFLTEIFSEIEDACNSRGVQVPKVIVEPGRFVTSRAQILLSTVQTIKKKANGKLFAVTDAGRLSITYPCDFEYHEVFTADRPYAELRYPYQVMGRICTSADWMLKNRFLPELSPGDILAVMDAGAYFSSYSSNFAFQRPAILMIDENQINLLRKEETFDHLVAMDAI